MWNDIWGFTIQDVIFPSFFYIEVLGKLYEIETIQDIDTSRRTMSYGGINGISHIVRV